MIQKILYTDLFAKLEKNLFQLKLRLSKKQYYFILYLNTALKSISENIFIYTVFQTSLFKQSSLKQKTVPGTENLLYIFIYIFIRFSKKDTMFPELFSAVFNNSDDNVRNRNSFRVGVRDNIFKWLDRLSESLISSIAPLFRTLPFYPDFFEFFGCVLNQLKLSEPGRESDQGRYIKQYAPFLPGKGCSIA